MDDFAVVRSKAFDGWCDEAELALDRIEARLNAADNQPRNAPLGGDGSHWVGCERVHIDCANSLLEEAKAENERLRTDAERLAEALRFARRHAKDSWWANAISATGEPLGNYPAKKFNEGQLYIDAALAAHAEER